MKISVDYFVFPKPCPKCNVEHDVFINETQCIICWDRSSERSLQRMHEKFYTFDPIVNELKRKSKHCRIVFGDDYEYFHQSFLDRWGKNNDLWAATEASEMCQKSSDYRIEFEWDDDPAAIKMTHFEITKTWYPKILHRPDIIEMNTYILRILNEYRDDAPGYCCYLMSSYDTAYEDQQFHVCWGDAGIQKTSVDETEFREYCKQYGLELKWVGACIIYECLVERIIPMTAQAMMMFKLRFGIMLK